VRLLATPRGSGGTGVHSPALLIGGIGRVGFDRLVLVGGVHARSAVEVLDGVQAGDLLIARREREGQPVLEQGQAEPDALWHDPLGAPTHGKDEVHQVGAAMARQLGECLQGLRGGLHGSSRLLVAGTASRVPLSKIGMRLARSTDAAGA